jgi:hypothetical protein
MSDKIIVPIGQFGPDRSPFDPNFTDTAFNVIPYDDHFGPFPGFQYFSGAVPAQPQGGYLADKGSGVWLPIVGTANALYKLDSSTNAWVDVSGNTAPYATPAGTQWSFTPFGNLVIATNGVDKPVQLDVSNPAAKFDLLSNDAPRGKNVGVTGDYLVFSNIAATSDKAVQWSGLNQPTIWDSLVQNSDDQLFADGGEIMNITGFEHGFVIFQEHCIREGSITGTNMIMSFNKTVNNMGVHARNSVVNTGAGIFFLSQDGFYRYNSGGQPQPIGVSRVDIFFYTDCSLPDSYQTIGVEDPARKIVYWAYRSKENTTVNTYDRILVYNYGVDRWSLIKLDFKAQMICSAVSPGYTLDNIGTLTGYNLDTLPWSLDSRIWAGSLPTFAAFDDQYRLGFFSSTPMKATIQTAELPLTEGRRSLVKGFTVQTDASRTDSSPSQKGRVARKDYESDPSTWGVQYPLNTTTGVIFARSSGKLHRFEVELPSGTNWKVVHGVEVQKDAGGQR